MNTTLITNSIPEETTPERWILLAPYGDHPHANGIQRVDEESVRRMVRAFHSLWGTIKRALIGRPVYHGHPDVPEYSEWNANNPHKDFTPYGIIHALAQRPGTSTQPGGLYARITLTEDGAKLVQAGIRWLSPYWKAEEIFPSSPTQSLEQNRPRTKIYRPIELLSVGLTTHPNICGESLANSQRRSTPPLPTQPMKTIALTQNLRTQYPCAIQTLHNQEQIRSFINEKRRAGQTYDDAFNFFFIQ